MATRMRRKQPMMDRNGRPPNFPYNQKLERLLLTYDPEIGYLELEMKRRHARALRRWLFGPNGVNIVPSDYGVMKFNLSKGWTLRLTFLGHDELAEGYADLGVDAEFIPPASGEKAPARATAEVRP